MAGEKMAEGSYRGKAISSQTVIYGDRLNKNMASRDTNRMNIITLGGDEELLDQERSAASVLRQILCESRRI